MRAQLSLEALLLIAALLLFSSIFLSSIAFQKQALQEFAAIEKARFLSIECAMIVNSLSSNGSELVSEKGFNCVGEENNRVRGTAIEKNSSSKTIARELVNKRVNEKDFLEVSRLEHYKQGGSAFN